MIESFELLMNYFEFRIYILPKTQLLVQDSQKKSTFVSHSLKENITEKLEKTYQVAD